MSHQPSLIIHKGYLPGAIGRIAELHAKYYHKHWNFGLYFESKVATELCDFLKEYDDGRDGIWLATVKGRIQGSIVIDGNHALSQGAHLRWFIVSDAVRGAGVGRALMDHALNWCRDRAYLNTYLWTFEGLDAARHLYEAFGFTLIKQQQGLQWGTTVNEQYFELSNP